MAKKAAGSLRLERMPLGKLNAAHYNPREIGKRELDGLRESLREFGLLQPVVWNRRTGRVVGGHQRLAVLLADGETETDVAVVDLDEARERALNVALNSPAIAGRFTEGVRELLLQIERDTPELSQRLEMPLLRDELDSHFGLQPRDVAETPQVPVPRKPKTRKGDLWKLGRHRLLCGDATVPGDVEKALGDLDDVALVFTSPPYADVRDYGGGVDLSTKHLAQFLPAWGLARLLVLDFGLLRRANEVLCYWEDYVQAARAAGLKFLAWNVWDRGQPWTVGQQIAMFPVEHEWLLVFGRDRFEVKHTVRNKSEGMRTNITDREKDGTLTRKRPKRIRARRARRALGSVVRVAPQIGGVSGHVATFPVALPSAYIEACTDEGQVVADPFLGSGTTILAAEQTGRVGVGVEIDPGYCEVSVARWEKLTGKKAERVRAGA